MTQMTQIQTAQVTFMSPVFYSCLRHLRHLRILFFGLGPVSCSIQTLLLLIAMTAPVSAQELTLHRDCETGFREIIRLAQTGRLGEDVVNANVNIDGNRVEIELVRAHGPAGVLKLTPKQSAQSASRYFDIAVGPGGSRLDAQRVGAALDAVFVVDPFDILGLEGTPGDEPIPGIAAAWGYGGWRGVARVLERRMMVLASVEYVAGVSAGMGVGVLAGLVLLWTSLSPSRERQCRD
jgi:hypothetical protein